MERADWIRAAIARALNASEQRDPRRETTKTAYQASGERKFTVELPDGEVVRIAANTAPEALHEVLAAAVLTDGKARCSDRHGRPVVAEVDAMKRRYRIRGRDGIWMVAPAFFRPAEPSGSANSASTATTSRLFLLNSTPTRTIGFFSSR